MMSEKLVNLAAFAAIVWMVGLAVYLYRDDFGPLAAFTAVAVLGFMPIGVIVYLTSRRARRSGRKP